MRVHIYMHTYRHRETCMYTRTGTHIQTYMYRHARVYTHACTYMCSWPPPLKRNLVLRPLSEFSNLTGAFVALVWV